MLDIHDWPLLDKERLFGYLRWNSYRSERYKIIYVATPKVACTSIKWWFADLEGCAQALREDKTSAETDPELTIHDTCHKVAPNLTVLEPDALTEAIISDAYFKFAVVRNPYKRIFSAWQSKLLLREPLQTGPYLGLEFFNRPIGSMHEVALAFEGFLEHLAEREAPDYWDVHWTPQVTLLRPDLIKYTKLVKIEDPKELSSALAKWLGPDFVDPFTSRSANESLIPFLPELITGRSAQLIHELYAEDFARFGYDDKLPASKECFSEDKFNFALKAISHIRARHQRMGEMPLQIANLNQAVSDRNGQIGSLNQAIVERDDHMGSLNQAIVERDGQICGLNQAIAERDDHIARLNQAVAERDGLIAKVVAESEALKNSTSWKITLPIRWLGRHAHDFKARITATPAEKSAAYVVRTPPPAQGYRPKVVHVIANFMTGGSSRLVVDLIENLGDCYDQSVVTSCIPSPPAYTGLHIDLYRSPADDRPFVDHFSRVKPDFIHVHYWGDCDEKWYAKAVTAAEELGIPVVENINTPIAPFQSPSVRRYVYVSDYVRHVFGRGLDDEITIYPGSDFSHFTRDEPLEGAEDCIGMVYRLERDKLSEQAIAPFIHAVRKRPQTRVLIVGGGSLLEPFRNAVEVEGLTGNFEFTGYVPYEELPDLYRRMAVFVAPVWKESFGQVSPFAMNMYIPVCGYDVGAIGEIIADPSLLAPAGDAERLADIVTRLLNSPEERSAAAANQHARAQSNFSLQAMIHSYRSLYKNMANVGSLK